MLQPCHRCGQLAQVPCDEGKASRCLNLRGIRRGDDDEDRLRQSERRLLEAERDELRRQRYFR